MAPLLPHPSPAGRQPCWPWLRRALEAQGNHSTVPLATANPEETLSLRPHMAPRSLSPVCMEAEAPVTGSTPGTVCQEPGSDTAQHGGKQALAAEDAGAAGRRA